MVRRPAVSGPRVRARRPDPAERTPLTTGAKALFDVANSDPLIGRGKKLLGRWSSRPAAPEAADRRPSMMMGAPDSRGWRGVSVPMVTVCVPRSGPGAAGQRQGAGPEPDSARRRGVVDGSGSERWLLCTVEGRGSGGPAISATEVGRDDGDDAGQGSRRPSAWLATAPACRLAWRALVAASVPLGVHGLDGQLGTHERVGPVTENGVSLPPEHAPGPGCPRCLPRGAPVEAWYPRWTNRCSLICLVAPGGARSPPRT